jgi:hypothetical protein
MSSLSSALRTSAALALLLFGLVELLRFLAALTGVAGFYAVAAFGALALLAGLAGVGLWLRTPWAPPAIVALGCVFAATRLIDAFVLGIRPWLFALLAAAAAVIVALLLAAWARAEARLPT